MGKLTEEEAADILSQCDESGPPISVRSPEDQLNDNMEQVIAIVTIHGPLTPQDLRAKTRGLNEAERWSAVTAAIQADRMFHLPTNIGPLWTVVPPPAKPSTSPELAKAPDAILLAEMLMLIHKNSPATIDAMLPNLPGVTRERLVAVVHAASDAGLIWPISSEEGPRWALRRPGSHKVEPFTISSASSRAAIQDSYDLRAKIVALEAQLVEARHGQKASQAECEKWRQAAERTHRLLDAAGVPRWDSEAYQTRIAWLCGALTEAQRQGTWKTPPTPPEESR